MAVPRHIKVVWRGVFNQTDEEWSFGLKFLKEFAANPDATIGGFDGPALIAATHALLDTSSFSVGISCTEIRLYDIGVDGRTVGNPRYIVLDPATQPTGTGATRYPPQIALVCTTVAENRGPAKLNRFYLPGPARALGSDFRISTSDRTTYVTNVTTFVKAVADAGQPANWLDQDMAVANISASGGGTLQTAQRVRVGRVYDTMRSRRRSLDEDYAESGDIDW